MQTNTFPDDPNYEERVVISNELANVDEDGQIWHVKHGDPAAPQDELKHRMLALVQAAEDRLPGASLRVGDTLRLYFAPVVISGKEMPERRLRGLFVNDEQYFYRTPDVDETFREQMLFGRTVQEWLDRFDTGRPVFAGKIFADRMPTINLELRLQYLFVDLVREVLALQQREVFKITKMELLELKDPSAVESFAKSVFEYLKPRLESLEPILPVSPGMPQSVRIIPLAAAATQFVVLGPRDFMMNMHSFSSTLRIKRDSSYIQTKFDIQNTVHADEPAQTAG